MKEIIIVDDDRINNHVCITMIKKIIENVSVTSFTNPNEALEYLINHKNNFEGLVIIDVNMPEMSGWQLIDLMDQNKIEQQIIMLTSSISYQDKESAEGIKMIKDFL